MPCFRPMQAFFVESVNKSGQPSRAAVFPQSYRDKFSRGEKLPEDAVSLPCGKCMACRLETSRQTALRCVHESKMYQDNCFVTLTFDDEHLPKMCPLTEGGYSLVRKHTQDFMKRLRQKFSDRRIRVYGCGEYGEKLGRPHYHFCLFNIDFFDRLRWKKVNGFWYYNSPTLSSLWTYGHSVVTDFSFETAAYVARYCTKKLNGDLADSHYRGRLPEFSVFSNRPGIGKPWLDRYGASDVYPLDECVARGVTCKVPRYYDRVREREDPEGFAIVKQRRRERALQKADDNTYDRLLSKEKCMEVRFKKLIRNLERE